MVAIVLAENNLKPCLVEMKGKKRKKTAKTWKGHQHKILTIYAKR